VRNRPFHISQACSLEPDGIGTFPLTGGLPGFRRASPSTPLDAYSYVLVSIDGRPAAPQAGRRVRCAVYGQYGLIASGALRWL
jgi:hypothetical protein